MFTSDSKSCFDRKPFKIVTEYNFAYKKTLSDLASKSLFSCGCALMAERVCFSVLTETMTGVKRYPISTIVSYYSISHFTGPVVGTCASDGWRQDNDPVINMCRYALADTQSHIPETFNENVVMHYNN